MSTPQSRLVSQSPLRFGDPRPTSHVSSTHGLPSRHASIDVPPTEGAMDLLRNVKEDHESEITERRRSGTFRVFGRRSPSLQGPPQSDNSTSKHYLKMGILMSDDSQVTQSLTTESGTKTSVVHKTHTLPSSSPHTRPSLTTEKRSDEQEERLPEGARPVTRPRTSSTGFEFVDIETDEQRDVVPQPSPPISVKSGSSNNMLELQSSSPDSGYGNTPEYVNAARSADSEVKGREQATKNETVTNERERGDTSNSELSIDSSPGRRGSVEKAPLKHTQSVPDSLTALNQQSLRDPVPERGVSFPFQMSLGQGRPIVHGTETRSVTNFGDMERQLQQRAHHHVNPSQPTPQPKVKGDVRLLQRKGLDLGRRKNRASSQPFATVADVQSVRSAKAGTLPPAQIGSTKDYFQVTDELSKENSHFSLSEALLNVIEQYKANCLEQQQEQAEAHTSPGTPPSNQITPWRWSPGGLTPLGGGHYLGSPSGDSLSASAVYYQGSPVGSLSSAYGISGSEVDLTTPTQSLTPPTQSKPATQLSLLELMQSPSWDNSAESTAQKLLRHMTGHMTQAGSGDSQVVVQVPTAFLTSLQKDEDLQRSVTTSSAHMRGNREWAPPRKQIIYSVKQPSRNLQKDLAAQGFRCTGCGMKVDPTYVKYFRFCNYTGKYFCPNCHMNATSIVPAHILDRWSFKKLAVSNFARDLLAEIHQKPVFTITSSNYSIYKRVSLMAQAKDLRAQLISVKQYLSTCREAQHLNLSFQGYAPWTVDLHTYSIEDFLEVKGGNKMKYLRAMLADAVDHIKSCPLCMGKGFVCELCNNDQDVIFPFEGTKVQVCNECQCCFHKTCYTPSTKCPRCHRMQHRLKQRARQQTKDYSNRPS